MLNSAPEGYELLANILLDALEQSSAGKGKERHANGLPFHEQPIITLGRQTGPGGTAFQSMKKCGEAMGMVKRGQYDAAERELLGSIVYAAATIALVRELKGVTDLTDKNDAYIGDLVAMAGFSPQEVERTDPLDALRFLTTAPVTIPEGIYWSKKSANFFSEDEHSGMGETFREQWFSLAHAFPKWPYDNPVKSAIPEGVYYNFQHNNFYDGEGHYGKGSDFFDNWYSRRGEFPSRGVDPIPI